VHRPGAAAPLDIVFVHGLGGNSQKTWSKNHDPELFWPGLWLPHDSDIGKARIFSFGYNADFRPGAGRSIANVADFAKELLFEMRFGRDELGDDFRVGKVPIIFVVHSMGGLVVKK
jgi:pimeloyl-ACP methyl ester carboxylesterase